MNDVKRALLGDQEAARRLTAAGVLLPCKCGNEFPMIEETSTHGIRIRCPICETTFTRDFYETGRGELGKKRTIEAWNTRAPILTPEELEMLEGMEHGN